MSFKRMKLRWHYSSTSGIKEIKIKQPLRTQRITPKKGFFKDFN